MDRYKCSTIYELNTAIKGHWRTWERNTAWMTREIIYMMIQGNPHIKSNDKPRKEQLYHLSIDEVKKEESNRLTDEQLRDIEKELREKMNGTS